MTTATQPLATIPTHCFRCRRDTPHHVWREYRSITNRPKLEVECAVCGTGHEMLGTLETAQRQRRLPPKPKRDRPDAFDHGNRRGVLLKGCPKCSGDLYSNYGVWGCLQCGCEPSKSELERMAA